ncbi:hypothetical protein ETD86_51755 [Nonomuraea turkmeniaca]|uniref:Uncharacterized protein n=1 Tax=Nonomuraea turkmeniaca TaxID=103838 RepID=A0A5S4EVJ0_9ACTN|nr:hypothetical protein [Nonomuraea turkmeniaca]TMR07311.1 hypothetical protein ETD86_51755 [Nonomuraea turkmeniaca]
MSQHETKIPAMVTTTQIPDVSRPVEGDAAGITQLLRPNVAARLRPGPVAVAGVGGPTTTACCTLRCCLPSPG